MMNWQDTSIIIGNFISYELKGWWIIAKPHIHSQSSAKRFGGKSEDYIDIHNFMDSSKAAFPDNRHRALTHNAWFIGHVLEKVFGVTRTNSDGRIYSVRDIGEQHVLEDFGNKYIPTVQDYLAEMEFKDWMNNGIGQPPPSHKKIAEKHKKTKNIKKISLDGEAKPQLKEPLKKIDLREQLIKQSKTHLNESQVDPFRHSMVLDGAGRKANNYNID